MIRTRFLNSDGYVQLKLDDGTLVKEHRLVAERLLGPIPEGWHVHHRDGNPANNKPENLELLPWPEHKRVHCGHWRDESGRWWKRCTSCGTALPEEAYPTKRYVNGERKTRGNCRRCDLERVQAAKQRRLAAARAADPKLA